MTFTVYGQLSNGTPAGPYLSGTTDVTAISSAITTSTYLFAFITGTGVTKMFANSANTSGIYGGSVVLPQFTTPNSVPVGAVAVNSSPIYSVESAYPWGLNSTTTGGMLYFAVLPAAGSPDVGSPQEFMVDIYTLFICAATSTQWNM